MTYDPNHALSLGQAKTQLERTRATDTEHTEMVESLGMNSGTLGVTLTHETFTFELEDGSTVEKEMVLWPSTLGV